MDFCLLNSAAEPTNPSQYSSMKNLGRLLVSIGLIEHDTEVADLDPNLSQFLCKFVQDHSSLQFHLTYIYIISKIYSLETESLEKTIAKNDNIESELRSKLASLSSSSTRKETLSLFTCAKIQSLKLAPIPQPPCRPSITNQHHLSRLSKLSSHSATRVTKALLGVLESYESILAERVARLKVACIAAEAVRANIAVPLSFNSLETELDSARISESRTGKELPTLCKEEREAYASALISRDKLANTDWHDRLERVDCSELAPPVLLLTLFLPFLGG